MTHTASSSDLMTPRKISALLAAVAGYVDSCTFLGLFGLFVAQVTGSFVIASAQPVIHDPGFLIKVLGIPFFLMGGVLTTVVVAIATARGGSAFCWALALEGLCLTGFLVIGVTTQPFSDPNGLMELMSALLGLSAMGVQSATVRLLMPGMASTNVMTTNTTLISIEVTNLVLAWRAMRQTPSHAEATDSFARRRHELAGLAVIVAGFLTGTVIGAFAFRAAGFWSLLVPTLIVTALSVSAAFSDWKKSTRPAM
jgi:uncharacterized membrane protein YoaK (UPF0700 family)